MALLRASPARARRDLGAPPRRVARTHPQVPPPRAREDAAPPSRFGGAINLNVHFHTLVPDGVFDLTGDGPARFIALPPPDDQQVARILASVIGKVEREVGRLDAETFADEDALASLEAREVDRRMRFPDPFKHPRRSSHLDGYSLHAGVRIHANDREGRERLATTRLDMPRISSSEHADGARTLTLTYTWVGDALQEVRSSELVGVSFRDEFLYCP